MARRPQRRDALAGVPVAAGGELHRQRRDAAEKFRAHLRRCGASARQRRDAGGEVGWRVRLALIDLRRYGDDPLSMVAWRGEPASLHPRFPDTPSMWTAPPWQELSELLQHWSGAVMCPACFVRR